MNKTKNRHITSYVLLGLLTAFLTFIAVFFLIDYSHYQKDKSPYRTFIIPRLEIAQFEVTNLTADKADMVGHMMIHNPLPFNLRADSLSYKIYIGDVEVIKSTYSKSLNIKKWDTTTITLPVTTYTDKMVDVLKNAEKEGKDSIIYRVEASFGTQLIVHKDFNINIEKLLPVFYIPELKLDEILYDSLSLDGVTLILPTVIVNKNKIDFKVKDLDFRFKLADNKWVEGKKSGVIDIKKQDSTHLTIPIRISFKEIGRSIGPLIREGKNTDFKLNVTMKLVSDNNALKNSVVVLNDAGAIKAIVRLAKEEKKKEKEKQAVAEKNGQPIKKEKHKHKLKIKKAR